VEELLAEAQDGPWAEMSLKSKVQLIGDSMLTAARDNIGMVRVTRPGREWMTREIRDAIRDRNRYARNLPAAREEFVGACQRVCQLTLESKKARWRQYVESLHDQPDSAQAWRCIKSLSDKMPSAGERNRVLIHGGREHHTDRAKADAFATYYAGVSRHYFSAAERKRNHEVKVRLSQASLQYGPDIEECQDFRMAELEVASDK
jgi:hypothetical protein